MIQEIFLRKNKINEFSGVFYAESAAILFKLTAIAVKLTGGLPTYNVGDGLDRPADTYYLEDHISAVTQNVEINGKKGETYSVGGWFKGQFDDNYIYENVPTQYTELAEQLTSSSAQIKVTYSYTDTVTETAEDGTETTTEQTATENFVVDFQPHNDGWQYAVDSFALKGDTESIDVTIIAKNIPEESFATGISLEQDLESEIIEDDDAETDFGDEEEICSCGCEECYYGENCPCTGAINNDCQCPECLRKETSTQDNFGNTLSNKSTDGINYIETLSQYTSDGNNLASYTDENGNTVTYDYNLLNSVLKSVTSPMGTEDETTTTNYFYDYMGKVVSVSTTANETEYQTLNYVYTYDRLTDIITPNGKYKIIYNDWGQVRSVNVVTGSGESENVIPLVEYTYNEGAKRTQVASLRYINSVNDIAEYTYEYYADGTVKSIFLNEEEIHYIEYDNLGVLTSIKNAGGRTVQYTDDGTNIYNAEDDCIYSTYTDDDGSVTEENHGVTYKTYAPESDYDSAIGVSTETDKIEINSTNRITQETNTDYFGRTNSQNLSVYNITDESDENPATLIGRINTEYEYSNKEDGKTASTIEKYVNKTYNGSDESVRVFDGYYYEYDKQNKISAEKTLNADGTTTDKYSYEYDKLGQLVRYNDAVENKTYTYTYDNNGNILTKSEYAYTTGDLDNAIQTTTYGYDTQWADKLTTVGDKTIAYDNIGNPTSYLGAALTWEGRQLKSYENDEKLVTYEYDENGMRYRTTVVDKTAEEETIINIDYVWLGEKIVSMVISDDETYLSAKYLYNSSGEVIGFKWVNDTAAQSTYYYLKNLQGDITGVVSATGKMQVSYSYDVFGKRTTKWHYNTSSLTWFEEMYNQIHISALNPFGYRGYCFDAYTELYYLQSRYYDPNTGRFINADDTNYLNATGTVLGCNLFAYCENDPVNRVDPRGTISLKLATALAAMGISLSVYNSFLCVRLYCWGFTHRKKNQTYDFSKKWKSLIKRRLESSKTMKNFVSKKINSMKKNGYSKKSYNFYPEFYKNLDKTISDLDLTLAIGGGSKFKITIKKTDKVDWVGRNYYEITADFKGEDFDFEAWEIEILGKVFGDVEPHTSNPAVIMINDAGYITQAYGAFVEFFWKFKVKYKIAI